MQKKAKLRSALARGVFVAGVRRDIAWGMSLQPCAAAALMAGAVAAMVAPQAAWAQPSAQAEFNIPAQPLDSALHVFSEQSKHQVLFEEEAVAGKRAPALNGRLAQREALDRLLVGSGVQVNSARPGVFTLKASPVQPATGDTAALSEVKVTAQAQRASELPEAYAGGQVARGGRVGLLGNMDVMDTPFNITSYTTETIENQQARSVADVLENNPAVQVQNAPGRNVESFMMRGFLVPTTNVAFNSLYGLLPVYRILPDFVERVEVLTGPNALLGGMSPDGSIGGGINLVPKRAGDVPLSRLTLGASADSQLRTHADVGRRFGDRGQWGIRVNGSIQSGDTPMDGQSQSSHTGALALDYRGERLRASVDLIDQKERIKGGMQFQFELSGSVPNAPRNTSISAPGAGYEGRDKAVVLRAEYDVTPDTQVYGAWGSRSDDHLAALGYPTMQSNGDYMARLATLRYAYDTRSGDMGVRTKFKTGSVGHQLSVSTNLYNEKSGMAFAPGAPTASNLYNPSLLSLPDTPGPAEKKQNDPTQ